MEQVVGAEMAMAERSRPKVLLVDDEQAIRFFVSRILQREGFDVLEASDGCDACSLLRRIPGSVDLLVTDVRMPRMTGIELVETVKVESPAMPVVYISGDPLHDQLHDPSSRVVFLQKPFRPQAILDAIRAVTSQCQAERAFGA